MQPNLAVEYLSGIIDLLYKVGYTNSKSVFYLSVFVVDLDSSLDSEQSSPNSSLFMRLLDAGC